MTNVKKITVLRPKPETKVFFELCEYLKVPETSGCYVLTNNSGDILYIGQTDNLHRRFQEHLDDSQKTQLTSEGRVFWFYYLLCEERDLDLLENSWLNVYETYNGHLPILNKRRAPRP